MTRDEDAVLRELGELARREEEEMRTLDEDAVYGELTATEQEELAGAVLGRLGLAPADEEPAVNSQPATGAEVVALSTREGDSPGTRRGAGTLWAAVAMAVAAAAVTAFWFSSDGSPGEALPEYALVQPRAEASQRGSEPEQGSHAIGRELEFILRPATHTDTPSRAFAFVEGPSGMEAFSPRAERAEGGTWLLTAWVGPGRELDLTRGQWRLCFYVVPGTPDTMDPNDPPRAPNSS